MMWDDRNIAPSLNVVVLRFATAFTRPIFTLTFELLFCTLNAIHFSPFIVRFTHSVLMFFDIVIRLTYTAFRIYYGTTFVPLILLANKFRISMLLLLIPLLS